MARRILPAIIAVALVAFASEAASQGVALSEDAYNGQSISISDAQYLQSQDYTPAAGGGVAPLAIPDSLPDNAYGSVGDAGYDSSSASWESGASQAGAADTSYDEDSSNGADPSSGGSGDIWMRHQQAQAYDEPQIDYSSPADNGMALAAPVAHLLAGGSEHCPDGSSFVRCLADPCASAKCRSGTVCVSNYCGGCNFQCVQNTAGVAESGPAQQQYGATSIPSASKAPAGVISKVRGNVANATKAITKPVARLVHRTPAAAAVSAGDSAAAAAVCPAGAVYSSRSSSCVVCRKGTYADKQLQACRSCAPGYVSKGPGAAACAPCAAGTFSFWPGASFCMPCPWRMTSTKGAARCSFSRAVPAPAPAAAQGIMIPVPSNRRM